jgi:hypothetical protein
MYKNIVAQYCLYCFTVKNIFNSGKQKSRQPHIQQYPDTAWVLGEFQLQHNISGINTDPCVSS